MSAQLYIPKTIKAGYNKRPDTYSGKLAYVIYIDDKGVVRKETSWKGWIEENMGTDDYSNDPTSGFVLNKRVGGYSSGWDHRQTYARIYDPRGFEFEITMDNLLWILQECDCTKGKGLEGEFVYSWEGKNLVLVPVSSEDYQKSLEYTKIQSKVIGRKDMVEGCIYMNKSMIEYIYLGKHHFYEKYQSLSTQKSKTKKFVFRKVKEPEDFRWDTLYHRMSTLSSLRVKVSDKAVDNFAFLLDEFLASEHASKIKNEEWQQITDKMLQEFINGYHYYGSKVKKYGETKYLSCTNKVLTLSNDIYHYYGNKDNYTISKEDLKKWDINVYVFENGFIKIKER